MRADENSRKQKGANSRQRNSSPSRAYSGTEAVPARRTSFTYALLPADSLTQPVGSICRACGHPSMVRAMQWATPEERTRQGQARRKQLGRQAHDALNIKARLHPAIKLLERSMRGRVPALVKLKYQLMADSPFGYFRGAVPVMAADLAALPNTGIVAQLCGDAHVRNLGAYAAPDGQLVFDIND